MHTNCPSFSLKKYAFTDRFTDRWPESHRPVLVSRTTLRMTALQDCSRSRPILACRCMFARTCARAYISVVVYWPTCGIYHCICKSIFTSVCRLCIYVYVCLYVYEYMYVCMYVTLCMYACNYVICIVCIILHWLYPVYVCVTVYVCVGVCMHVRLDNPLDKYLHLLAVPLYFWMTFDIWSLVQTNWFYLAVASHWHSCHKHHNRDYRSRSVY